MIGRPSAARPTNHNGPPAAVQVAADKGSLCTRRGARACASSSWPAPTSVNAIITSESVSLGSSSIARRKWRSASRRWPRSYLRFPSSACTYDGVRPFRDQRLRHALGLIERRLVRRHPQPHLPQRRPRPHGHERRRFAFDANGFFDERDRRGNGVAAELLPRVQVQLERARIGDRAIGETPDLLRREPHAQRLHDLPRHPLLHLEHVVHRPAVLVRPERRVGRDVDELRRDPQAVPCLADAAFQHVAHVKVLADRAHALLRALELHRRRARDHLERADLRQVCDQLFGEPVAEVLVVGIRAQVRERQDDDRSLISAFARLRSRGRGARLVRGPERPRAPRSAHLTLTPNRIDLVPHVPRRLNSTVAIFLEAARDQPDRTPPASRFGGRQSAAADPEGSRRSARPSLRREMAASRSRPRAGGRQARTRPNARRVPGLPPVRATCTARCP